MPSHVLAQEGIDIVSLHSWTISFVNLSSSRLLFPRNLLFLCLLTYSASTRDAMAEQNEDAVRKRIIAHMNADHQDSV